MSATPRPLVRTSWFDPERWRAALRDRVVSVRTTVGGCQVEVTPEPLLRSDAGELKRSIRVRFSPGLHDGAASGVEVRLASGVVLSPQVEPAPQGTIRVLVPEVQQPTSIALRFPSLDRDAEVRLELTPLRRWTIHLIHHSHFDIGYTDTQGRVLTEQLSFLDSCLDLARATEDWPDDARFRWCVESLWVFNRWVGSRPARSVEEFIERVREGNFELTALPFNMHSEACSTDELHELLRGANDLHGRWGISPVVAMQTDVPGAVVGLPDVLGEHGVRYLSVAHNWAGRSVPQLVGGQNLPRLFKWRGDGGHDLLVWMTDTPHGLAYMEGPLIGFDVSFEAVDDQLPAYLTSLAANPYPYEGGLAGWAADRATIDRRPYPWDLLQLRVQGRFGDNAPPRLAIAECVRRWNDKWAWPHLRLSRNVDFFEAAEKRLGSEIETFHGDWNDWWAEGLGSAALPVSINRRAQSMIADAQTVAAMAGQGTLEPSRVTDTYESLALFDEHTWGAANPWTDGDSGVDSGEQQWHWKYAHAVQAHDGASDLLERAANQLGERLGALPSALASFWVVNTAGFDRSDVVQCFLPESLVPADGPVAVMDSRSGLALPCRISPQVNENHRNAGRSIEFRMDAVPAVGGVRVDVMAGSEGDGEPRQSAAQDVLENRYLRVTIDLSRSCIVSIVEKVTGRELVNCDAAVGFNGYIYDQYASVGGFNHQANKLESSDRLELLAKRSVARPAVVMSRTSDAIAEQLVFETPADGARWVRTTLTLHRDSPRLDIENRLSKPPTMAKESAYFAFPFAFRNPVVRVEVTGGVVGSGISSVPGGAQHMRAMRRWVSLEEDGFAAAWVTRDAPLIEIGQLALPYAPFPPTLEPEPATLYSWVHNNLWDTNFPPQQGFETTFHYAVAAAPVKGAETGPSLAMRTATAVCRPLRAVLARSTRDQPEAEVQLLAVEDPRIRLVGLSEPRLGRLLVRLQSTADEPVVARLRLGMAFERAERATFLGDPTGELAVIDNRIAVEVPARGIAAALLTLPV
jgi:hypothetical protein